MLTGLVTDRLIVYNSEKTESIRELYPKNEERNEDLELPLFDLYTIATATDNFSYNNKLGEGGFGPVYKVSSD